MIEYRFGLPPLTRRDRYAHNIARAFDWDAKPRLEPRPSPTRRRSSSQPCRGNPDGDAERAARSTTSSTLVTSGYLDRLGFDFRPRSAEDAFRRPDAVRSGLVGAR